MPLVGAFTRPPATIAWLSSILNIDAVTVALAARLAVV
jgi:hypothetical protein